MIFERIEDLCKKNNTTITALCIEITGSSGNLSTWKKDNIKPNWLIPICKKFEVSADFILTGNNANNTPSFYSTPNEHNLLLLYRQLSDEDKKEIEELIEFKISRYKKENSIDVSSSPLTDSLTG